MQLAIFILICLVAFPSTWAIRSGQAHIFFSFQDQNLNDCKIGTPDNSSPYSESSIFYLVDDKNPTGYAQVLAEYSSTSSTPTVTYGYGLDLSRQRRGSTFYYYGYDGQGSVRELYPASGTLARYDDDAYGMLLATSGSIQNFYRYTGRSSEWSQM